MDNGDRANDLAKLIGAAGIALAAIIRVTKALLDRRRQRSNKMLCQRISIIDERLQDVEYRLALALSGHKPREPD